MTKVKKRALELMHLGYTPHNSTRRVFPKWRQACAIAKSEEHQVAALVGARLMGTASAEAIARKRVFRAVHSS